MMVKILRHPYTQLTVGGRSVCEEISYQKGIDNMLLMRKKHRIINEL